MGFREFDQGMTAKQVAEAQRIEAERHYMERHRQEEDLIQILRPLGDDLPMLSERYLLWIGEKS